jgi:hypothetical protein
MSIPIGADLSKGGAYLQELFDADIIAVGAGGGGSPPPAPKNLFHRQTHRRLLDELGDRFPLRNVDRVAAFRLGDSGIRTLGHQTLSGGRDHPIVSGNQVNGRGRQPRHESGDIQGHARRTSRAFFSFLVDGGSRGTVSCECDADGIQ